MRGALCAPQPPAFRAGAENLPVDIYTNSIISAYKSVSANILLLFHAGNRRRKAGRGAPLFLSAVHASETSARRGFAARHARALPYLSVRSRVSATRPPPSFFTPACPALAAACLYASFQPFFRHANGRFGTCRSARNYARRFASGPGCSAVRRGARACREMRRASPVLRTRRRFRASPCAPSEAGPRAAPPPASFLAARPRVRPFGFCNDRAGGMVFPLRAPLPIRGLLQPRRAPASARSQPVPAASRFPPPTRRPCACHALRPPRPCLCPAPVLTSCVGYAETAFSKSRIKKGGATPPPLLFCGISPLLLPHDRKT